MQAHGGPIEGEQREQWQLSKERDGERINVANLLYLSGLVERKDVLLCFLVLCYDESDKNKWFDILLWLWTFFEISGSIYYVCIINGWFVTNSVATRISNFLDCICGGEVGAIFYWLINGIIGHRCALICGTYFINTGIIFTSNMDVCLIISCAFVIQWLALVLKV